MLLIYAAKLENLGCMGQYCQIQYLHSASLEVLKHDLLCQS